MRPIIIGIGYKKGVGKDTVANRLVDKHGFVRMSFADPLKEACRVIFHFTDAQLHGDKKEVMDHRWDKTPRQILQLVGTEAIRNVIDKDVWIKSLQIKIDNLQKANPGKQLRVAIPDVRFPNEAEAVHAMEGGLVWKVDRVLPLNEFSSHASEVALDPYTNWSAILNNRSSMAELYKLVDQEIEKTTNEQEISYAFSRRRPEAD